MTSTTTRPSTTPVEDPHAGTPPKLVRRPIAIAAGAVVALAGGLGAGWLWNTLTNVDEILVLVDDVPRGSVIEAGDLGVATLNADPLLKPVPASSRDDVVGKRAAVDLSAGSLLTPTSTTDEMRPAAGRSLVPIELTPAQATGLGLQVGDAVKVVDTPEARAENVGNPASTSALVALIGVTERTGATVVSLEVPSTEAGVLAARIATGNVALVLESRER
ncbi:SAF domain protein [Xylanimonas cellulosilytica DSM 15894]|uniref:SAF domain protein n=1 Tax=Xylanimonas cellulosilytica (strain DSM 15894 / JCM 12276 / CECT 5975 / KCTC 9989 / LMG 20990 / NBRC 107835 / XIL07) TaxID=446471 RepID=D1BY35_XYLCX|nr:SAF domain-containing protein [Xylanimonas cellulosilytica]ACZ29878.1 SAF domain protein [Xylanimonas cellulosilytica DSM 15894]